MKRILLKRVLIFDLDGVLLDTKSNMQLSWKAVQDKFNIGYINFNEYFSKIGQPFYEILKQLGIRKNHRQIKICYDKNSILNSHLIKYYPKTIGTLKKLKKDGFILCIVTSKDARRTKLLLKNNLYLFSIIQCPQKNLKGKPNIPEL